MSASHALLPSGYTSPGTLDPRFPGARFLNYPQADLDRDLAFAEIVNRKPRLWTLRDVWMLPGYSGVYDGHGFRLDYCNGVAVPSDVPVRGIDLHKTAASNDSLAPVKLDRATFAGKTVVAEPVLFLGWFVRHYGHFLTDSMARLWAHVETSANVRRMLGPCGDPSRARIPYIATILAALGLTDAGLEIKQPTLFKELVVPEPSLQSRYRLFENADAAHMEVTERIEGRRFDRPVYLSRSGVTAGLREIPGEREIERLFSTKGFEIVHPEGLDLADQIGLFNSAPIIAGFGGSAFHTSLFSRRSWQGETIVLTGNEVLSTRFLLIDALKGYPSTYIRVGNMVSAEGQKPRIESDIEQVRAGLNDLGV